MLLAKIKKKKKKQRRTNLCANELKQVWDIKQQSATLVWDLKEHKKAVTCFSLFEPGESLLSGSSDKTIRVFAKHIWHSTIDLPSRKCKSSIF